MSSSGRTTSKSGKGIKLDKSHKSDGGKGSGDKGQNKENIFKNEELSIKEKVKQLMDLSRRSEDEVCLALHETDNDLTQAAEILLEECRTGEWETKDKKKKKRQASTGKEKKCEDGTGGTEDDWEDQPPPNLNKEGAGDGKDWKERSGGRRENRGLGGPPRRWRDDGTGGNRGGDRRPGGRGGPSRGGGRGRGGGRAGGRFPPRGNRGMGSGGNGGRDYNQRQPAIETWDNSNTWDNSTAAGVNHTSAPAEEWDDFHTDEWSTEEYTGSLVETKVFTPSVQQNLQENCLMDSNNVQNPNITGLEQNLSGGSGGGGHPQQDNAYSQSLGQTFNQPVQQQQQLPPPQQSPVPPMIGTLTAAQTQYFSQLSQQNSDALDKSYSNATYQQQQQQQPNPYDSTVNNKSVQQIYNSTSQQQVQPGYGNNQQSFAGVAQQYSVAATQQPSSVYGNQTYNNAVAQTYASQNYGGTGTGGYGVTYGSGQEVQQTQPRMKTRARVPPPSKIPASAVEMPGDINSSMTYLDVQFGAMDLIDNSFDSNSVVSDVKYTVDSNRSTGNLENSRTTPTTNLDLVDSSGTRVVQSITSDTTNCGSSVSTVKNGTQNSISSALSQSLSNSESIPQSAAEHLNYNNVTSSNRNNSQNSSNVNVSVPSVTATSAALDLNKSSSDNNHSYGAQTYNTYQPTKANTYAASPYSSAQTTASSYVNPAASYVSNQAYVAQNQPGSTAYGNSYSSSSTTQSYQNASIYPSVTQTANSYQAAQPNYSTSNQNPAYGTATSGLSNNPNFTSTNQYNSYNSTAAANSHKLSSKDNSYESGAASTTNSNVSTSSNTTSLSSLSQSTIGNTKSTATLAKNSTSVMSNIPPGVAPVMSTPYIMSQVPYFQQPVYSYEELQLLQQRLPHMTTPYYDMGYQTPTTLATVRDPTAAAAACGYGPTTADGRFQTTGGRAVDSTTSPVPGAASQQQQQQQAGPILAAAAGTVQPYFFTAFNTIAAAPPNYPQFGTMYTQLPAVTSASQYGQKPTSYGSAAYGTYDALGQSAPQEGQVNSTTQGSTANDLCAMYGKPHAALNKINSYDKQGFHSGTPQPLTAAEKELCAMYGKPQGALNKINSYDKQGFHSGTPQPLTAAEKELCAMYGKPQGALNKINSYDKQGFHSGTLPPFTGTLNQNTGLAPSGTGYAPQVYIPTMPQQHSTMTMHHQLHQMDVVRHQGRRADSGNSNTQRSQNSSQTKSGSKQGYGAASYGNQN